MDKIKQYKECSKTKNLVDLLKRQCDGRIVGAAEDNRGRQTPLTLDAVITEAAEGRPILSIIGNVVCTKGHNQKYMTFGFSITTSEVPPYQSVQVQIAHRNAQNQIVWEIASASDLYVYKIVWSGLGETTSAVEKFDDLFARAAVMGKQQRHTRNGRRNVTSSREDTIVASAQRPHVSAQGIDERHLYPEPFSGTAAHHQQAQQHHAQPRCGNSEESMLALLEYHDRERATILLLQRENAVRIAQGPNPWIQSLQDVDNALLRILEGAFGLETATAYLESIQMHDGLHKGS